MNSNYEHNSFTPNYILQNIYIVCEKSAVDLPQFIGSNKLGSPIKAFENIYDAEQFINESSLGLRYIVSVPLQKKNFQPNVSNIIYNIMPPQQEYHNIPHNIRYHYPNINQSTNQIFTPINSQSSNYPPYPSAPTLYHDETSLPRYS
jgi:hypothetical protein